jgi:hypothetical protein
MLAGASPFAPRRDPRGAATAGGPTMFTFTRKATLINAAYTSSGIGWAMEVTGYLNKTYNLHMKAGMQMFGGLALYWQFDVDSLDKLSALNTKLVQDKTYLAMLDKAKDLWVPGSLKDVVVNYPT